MPRKRRKHRFGSWSTRSAFSKPVNMPAIGQAVKQMIYELEISVPALAKRLNVSADRAYRLLRRDDWRVSEIMNVSTIVAYNLFDWYAEQTQPKETAEAEATANAENVQLKQRVAQLEAENKLLREIMENALKGK